MKICKGCGLIHRKGESSCSEAERGQINRDRIRLKKALNWVLEFGSSTLHRSIHKIAGKALTRKIYDD